MAKGTQQSISTEGWTAKELYEDYEGVLKGDNLVAAGLEYTNDELLTQANRYSKKDININAVKKNLSNAIERKVIADKFEPESYCVDYYNRRGRRLQQRFPTDKSKWQVPLGKKLAVRKSSEPLPLNPTLAQLKEHSHVRDLPWYLAFKTAAKGLKPEQIAQQYGGTAGSALNLLTDANSRHAEMKVTGVNTREVSRAPLTSTAASPPSPTMSSPIKPARKKRPAAYEAAPKAKKMKTTAPPASSEQTQQSSKSQQVSRRVSNALLAKRDELSLGSFSIATLTSIVDVLQPFAESGETEASIRAFQFFCASHGSVNFSERQIGWYMGWVVSVWLGESGVIKGTFLRDMTDAVKGIKVGYPMMVEVDAAHKAAVAAEEAEA